MTAEERILIHALVRFLVETLDLDDEDLAYMTVGDAVDEVAQRGKLPEHPEHYGRAIELAEDMLMSSASRVTLPYLTYREYVAENTSTPGDVLAALAQDDEITVRVAVAFHTSTPREVLVAFAKDENPRVREGVARNTSTPAEVLAAFAEDEDASSVMLGNVAENTSTPVEVLIALAQHADLHVRQGVARNTSTPEDVIMALTMDRHRFVRNVANAQLRHHR